MTEVNVIARPYAEAAFTYALAEQALPAWQKGLAGLAECIAHPKVQWVLQSPNYTPEQAGECVLALMADLLSPACQRFVQLLAINKRLNVLSAIYALFVAAYRAYQHILPVTVTTAIALDPNEAKALITALTAQFARQVEVTYDVDSTILGGVIVRAGDKVIDGSFAGQLTQLKHRLMA